MQVELRKNGKLQVRLTASDGIDSVLLDAMVAKAQQGQVVRLEMDEGCAVFSMEAE